MENSPKAIRCKAAVCRAPGEPLVIEEVEVAPPKAFEVRIKIICTSLCHSDLTFWRRQDFSIFLPRILGHEAFGFIESLGDGVNGMEVGDAVVPTFLSNCGECRECRSEKGNFCSVAPFSVFPGMPRDGTVRFTDAAGQPVNNFLGVSSFCEYTVVDIAQVTKVDSALPPEKACLLSCGVSTGVGAVRKIAAVEAGSSVVIFGLGAVGLAVVEGARFQGAAKIIGVDVNPDKFDIGKKLGLTHFVNPKDNGEKSVVEIIKEMTDGGADYCFECIGLASLMSDAFNCSRLGVGKTIILGVEMHGNPISIDSAEILKGKCIMGSLFGGIKAKTDIPILAKQYLNKELHLDEFITHEVNFMDINKAFDLLVQGKSLRCIIWMNQ
ncbi:alcohol dehydrogenase-like 7 [Dendrobium catenatum]|uniref:Alcohol dehydrogenase-like 7 n=1 Tax=Dendrobium catenatum TaxID=906689 RepID=A0A2I0XA14_9ASPA|nr:alcohol dehydrogenase-like 7 [Dendrobium catenatum]PKU84730.1 Alcohol dehydrogenase-like 7 [Dendrobium catenatum]